jgi:tetraacyldisaccharide 4'-kinase
VRWVLWPLEQTYGMWMRLRARAFERRWLPSQRLPAKVISVGNLTVGGTGKTPMVLYLARRLAERGLRPVVLTRGYGRRTRSTIVLAAHADLSHETVETLGDEPLLMARRLPELTLGIGPDRFRLGQQILTAQASTPPPVFLLDDGFQHLRLARDLDMVLIDATDPFGGNALLPAGRLREPLEALARASLFVLTRITSTDRENGQADAVRAAIRHHNPSVPVFSARMGLEDVFDATTHKPADLATLRNFPALAFCGIGNPRAFAQDLWRWGFPVAGQRIFSDHHRYRVQDFAAIIRHADRVGARWLVTTEKDVTNFTVVPPSHPPCYYVRIALEIEEEEDFLEIVIGTLEKKL